MQSEEHFSLYKTGRPVIQGTKGIVAAGHYLTAASAMRILLNGGNAFDAAAAAGFTAPVVEPTAHYSLATEVSILMYHAATKSLRVISGQGVSPNGATYNFFNGLGLEKIPTGPSENAELSFTVPGAVDAFALLLETYGFKRFEEILAPAIEYAEHGFPMYDYLYNRLTNPAILEQFKRYPPGGIDIFYPGGSPIEVGKLILQPQLASQLRKMATAANNNGNDRESSIRAGRDVFYKGEVAEAIIAASNKVGGLLSTEDLSEYSAKFEEPIKTSFGGYDIYAQGAWSQGGVLLQALNIVEKFDLRSMGHNSAKYIHVIAEALKLAFADREAYYGDPDFSNIPIDGLISKEYGAIRASSIDSDRAFPELPLPGDPWVYSKFQKPNRKPSIPLLIPSSEQGFPAGAGTTHFSIIDNLGNIVCATPSGGELQSSIFFPDLGFTLSTRSEMFFLAEGHPNSLEPKKRPRTTLINYIVCKNDTPVMTVGCPGGDNQAQANLQMILNILIFKMNPQLAVELPRFSTWSFPNSFYPRGYFPGQLNVEAAIPSSIRKQLSLLGHDIVQVDPCGAGAIVTQLDPNNRTLSAGADPRRPTYAIGW